MLSLLVKYIFLYNAGYFFFIKNASRMLCLSLYPVEHVVILNHFHPNQGSKVTET